MEWDLGSIQKEVYIHSTELGVGIMSDLDRRMNLHPIKPIIVISIFLSSIAV